MKKITKMDKRPEL